MKTWIIAGLAACTLGLFSCSHDDNASPESQGIMVGKWKVTSIQYTGTSVTNVEGEATSADFKGVGKDMSLELTFSQDPNKYTATGSYTISLSTNILGYDFPIDMPITGFMGNGTWMVKGKYIYVTDAQGRRDSSTITSLDPDHMTVAWGNTQSMIEEGISVQVTAQGTYAFTKE